MTFIVIAVLLYIISFFRSRVLFNVSILIVGVYLSVTFGYGYDWMNYYDSYLNLNTVGYEHFFYEPGYLLCMKFFDYIGFDFQFFYAITISFIYFSLYLFCRKMRSPSIAFFTLFSFLGFYIFAEGIRQGVAFAICLFALGKALDGKKKSSIILISIAILFHVSSVFCFLYFFIINQNKNSVYKFSLISTVFVFSFLFFIYNPDYLSFIPVVGPKFAIYSQIYAWEGGGFFSWLMQSRVFFLYVFFLIVLFVFIIQDKNAKIYNSISVMYFLTLSRMTPILLRFGFYLPPALVIAMDKYLSEKGRGKNISLFKLVYLSLILLISTMPFWDYTYMKGAEFNLNIFSSKQYIESTINNKCSVLNRIEINGVIRRCM
ncbi:EpsG family protein [Pectobacterium aroidearum]|uniref:EpsG family protein n=1 Tax=Pectobacterium aroidearum TaxID=1201031 RepID=UPI002114DD62|nr:EpsG family protein [Pectobacterium aroidearum]UUE43770.1 EpsG family protein [Pectobacterium aroidearum]UUE47991.1 EpsG family protein [Pectobacterium aroidearum]UUE52196.1 EpsG family protein [Pectobacterium aroidearum]UUE60604.1 EpsG family protein [Pectobacterium aroidearum]UUE64827.1 EpsG family protein [Pectobacterium aroidearum]